MIHNKPKAVKTGLYFTFPEAIELLTEYSNHINSISFLEGDTHIYRHKGYLYLGDANENYCMDSADARHLELILGDKMEQDFYIKIGKMLMGKNPYAEGRQE